MLEQLTIEFIAFSLVGIIGVVGLIVWGAVKKAAKSALSSKNISPSRSMSGIELPQRTDIPRPSPSNATSKANYAKALEEIETGAIDKGTWALALSESLGKEQEARALYIRHRAAELSATTVVDTDDQFYVHLRELSRNPIDEVDGVRPESFDGDPKSLIRPQSVSALADRMGLLDFQIVDLIKSGRLKGVRFNDEWYVDMAVTK